MFLIVVEIAPFVRHVRTGSILVVVIELQGLHHTRLCCLQVLGGTNEVGNKQLRLGRAR